MVKIEEKNSVVYARLSGDIDHHSAKLMREQIDEEVRTWRPKELVLDFREVTFMDSSGIGLVMGRFKLMQSLDGELKATGMSSSIKRVMRLAGLDKLAVMK